MKKAIFITVRTDSTRLPRKCLLEIGGLTTIEFLIQRLKKATSADTVVLCTTELEEDDVLCRIASHHEIECSRGSAMDKLMRWLRAAEKFDVEFFVTADGDDLFCEPELIDLAFKQYDEGQPDFIESDKLPSGAFTYGIAVSALRKVCEIKDTDDTEMMWVYFKDTQLFKIEQLRNIPPVYNRPTIRMTLDYPDDLRFFKNVIEGLGGPENNFSLKDILEYLDKNPDVIKINQYLQEEFRENQKRNTKLLIKKS